MEPAMNPLSLSCLLPLVLLSATGCIPKDDSGGTGGPKDLRINEFMASNAETVQDESGAFPDWIEVYNTSGDPVSLAGVFLSDDKTSPEKASLDASLTIEGGGYLLLWADDDGDAGVYHLPFSLKKDGEDLKLSWFDGVALYEIDTLSFGPQETDVSEARIPDGTDNWTSSTSPTPGSSNR